MNDVSHRASRKQTNLQFAPYGLFTCSQYWGRYIYRLYGTTTGRTAIVETNSKPQKNERWWAFGTVLTPRIKSAKCTQSSTRYAADETEVHCDQSVATEAPGVSIMRRAGSICADAQVLVWCLTWTSCNNPASNKQVPGFASWPSFVLTGRRLWLHLPQLTVSWQTEGLFGHCLLSSNDADFLNSNFAQALFTWFESATYPGSDDRCPATRESSPDRQRKRPWLATHRTKTRRTDGPLRTSCEVVPVADRWRKLTTFRVLSEQELKQTKNVNCEIGNDQKTVVDVV